MADDGSEDDAIAGELVDSGVLRVDDCVSFIVFPQEQSDVPAITAARSAAQNLYLVIFLSPAKPDKHQAARCRSGLREIPDTMF